MTVSGGKVSTKRSLTFIVYRLIHAPILRRLRRYLLAGL